MTTLREAATQALEAMLNFPDDISDEMFESITALKAALAEPRPIHECYGDCPTNPQTCPNPCNFEGRPRPVQEPVAIVEQLWSIIDDIDTYTDMAKADDKLYRSLVERRQADRWKTGITTDGYTLNIPSCSAPTQRKPLTEEEIKECERQAMVNGSLPFEQRVFFARAIERAHGIGGSTMSREVCGICWCPYDEETGKCGCAPPATPNCSNCASLQEQNTELDRKLAEMEAKLNNQSVDDAFRILAEANRRAIDYINELERQINELKRADPTHRKPLTEEEIVHIIDDVLEGGSLVDVARAVERAHGIE